jgi:hypothetical protein
VPTTALVVVVVLWSSAVTCCRVVAARQKAGPGAPWFADFIGLGWLRATTPRGKQYAHYAVVLLWAGAPLLFLTFFAFAGR